MERQTRVLIALSSFTGPLMEGYNTGVYVVEAMHPYQVFTSNNCHVEFASESGSFGWDEKSADRSNMTAEDLEFFRKDQQFNTALKSISRAAEVNPNDYDIIYFAGGHGCCFDFPNAHDLKVLAAEVHNNDGIVAAVCHGPIIFDDMKTHGSDTPLIHGKKITGFTDEGEREVGVEQVMKQRQLKTVKQVAENNGAQYQEPSGSWVDFTVSDGRILTGVNPQSAGTLAKDCLNELKHLKASRK